MDVAQAPPISSPEFWKRPERVTASSDPDEATAQTIRIMCGHVNRSAQDEGVRAAAHDAWWRFGVGGLTGSDNPDVRMAGAAFWWCKTFVKFVHHELILQKRLGEAGHLQGLISPEVLVRMDRPEGDCAIFSECVCAFLRVLGVPYEFVTVAVNPNEPEIFSHVYVYAVMPDGSRLPLDASHGAYPGWQVPSSDVSRRQVWDASGNPVADRGSRFDGLHSYTMRGLGQDEYTPTTDFIEAGLPTDYYNPTQQFGNFFPAGSGSGGGFNWGSLIGNLANQWTQIGSHVIAPTTTYQRDAQGNIIYSTPGSAAPPGALTSAGSSSLLLIGGLAIGGLLLFSMMGKK